MPVPSSGALRLRADIAAEVDGSATGTDVSLGTLSNSAGFAEPDTMSEFYGYSSVSAPTVQTDAISNVTATSMTLNGNATADNGASITSKGFYFGTNSSYASNTKRSSLGSGTGSFTENVTGLTAATTYYVTSYAINSIGESVGSTISSSSGAAVVPTISQGNAAGIGETTAYVDGSITDSGGNNASQSNIKFYFGTNSNVTSNPNYQCVKLGGTTGASGSSYRLNISGATAATTYYYAFNVTNSAGQSTTPTKNFTTASPSLQMSGSLQYGSIAGYSMYANACSSPCISSYGFGSNQFSSGNHSWTSGANTPSGISLYGYCNWTPWSSLGFSSSFNPSANSNGTHSWSAYVNVGNVVNWPPGSASCGTCLTTYVRYTKSGYTTGYVNNGGLKFGP
nr:hypothetical protein [uncultured Mediterranean phage uvMED]|tara:strand:- start:775 stop:1962 length:1188 start_codon:yes stop_codon:yes gene_type:complete